MDCHSFIVRHMHATEITQKSKQYRFSKQTQRSKNICLTEVAEKVQDNDVVHSSEDSGETDNVAAASSVD